MSLCYNRTYTLVAWSLDVLWSKIYIIVTSFVPICLKIITHYNPLRHCTLKWAQLCNSYECGCESRSNTHQKIGEDTLKIYGIISSLFILEYGMNRLYRYRRRISKLAVGQGTCLFMSNLLPWPYTWIGAIIWSLLPAWSVTVDCSLVPIIAWWMAALKR